jgi:hypothetical protein
MSENELLEHAVLNQIETDLNEQDFDALSEMLSTLIKYSGSRKTLIGYLSDSARENWIGGKTNVRY